MAIEYGLDDDNDHNHDERSISTNKGNSNISVFIPLLN